MEALRKAINGTFQSVCGLHGILITDREGVPIMKTVFEGMPDFTIRPALLASHVAAIEHTAKMGLGELKHVVSNYTNHRLVAVNFHSVIATFVGGADLNCSLIVSLKDEIAPVIGQLKEIVFS
uniref:Ragulator complex protein LAMTOR3 n=1 Tax=Romanomermis culicivorax TaxID=13658 RepID=A0A915KJ07_ROMCU